MTLIEKMLEKIFFTQTRVGINGTTFTIYKLHTMVGAKEGEYETLLESRRRYKFGHIENDPRITRLGKYLRRHWIDELPQILNVIRGDMSLLGVRPVRPEVFDSLPDDLKELRKRCKPGFIGCTYADYFDIETYGDHLKSERRYLEEKLRNPLRTDIKYFLRFCHNALRGATGS